MSIAGNVALARVVARVCVRTLLREVPPLEREVAYFRFSDYSFLNESREGYV